MTVSAQDQLATGGRGEYRSKLCPVTGVHVAPGLRRTGFRRPNRGGALTRQNGAGTDPGGAVHLGEADAPRPRDLAIAGLTTKLKHDLVHLA